MDILIYDKFYKIDTNILDCFSTSFKNDKNICKLQNIRSLDLDFCKIKKIDKKIKNLKSLLCINLTNNKITKVCKELAKLKKLTILSLEYNPILLIFSQEMWKIIRKLVHLKKIYIST